MTARRRRIAIVTLMILSAALAAIIFRPLKSASDFYVPDAGEADAAQALFRAALGARPAADLQEAAEGFGLWTTDPGQDWPGYAMAEAEDDCRGRGAYLMRHSAGNTPVAITAPHRGFDLHTGTIASHLFMEQSFAAAAWNSAPRKVTDECAGGGDIAREETHYFTAFARAFAQTYPNGRIIQLHGFDRAKRGSAAAANADIIISNGTANPSSGLLDLADCLSSTLHPRRVAVYPIETSELGALTNAQGQALRDDGFDGFVHLEIALQLRRDLVDDRGLRDQLASCIAQTGA